MVRQNSTLHRDFELPTISKFMKDASERFFDIASNHPNPLLVEAVTYEPPPPNHFCRRPRNVLIDPPDDLTVEVEKLELNKMEVLVQRVGHTCVPAHGRPIMVFPPSHPSHGRTTKKKAFSQSQRDRRQEKSSEQWCGKCSEIGV
ncbi:hypothetical protein EVAR_87213_1 [Eumeta japonica]|uniref:Uncharacterized protein n=1 Tax=Eumeta variegata TaxID=151549 RepID=A0A4C1VWC8_EUMVA|nr:hypothetical protein EVAR_87213_1 [Eumeta japonica]